MPKLPVLSGRELIRILGKIGFFPARIRGSHIIFIRSDVHGKQAVVVPNHKEIDKGTLVEIIRQAGLKREDFFKLLD